MSSRPSPAGKSSDGPLRSVLLRVPRSILLDRGCDGPERVFDALAVLFRGAFHVLVGDVRLAHLKMGIHATTRQAHARNLLLKVIRAVRRRRPHRPPATI